MKKYAFLRIMSVICFLYGLIAVISFIAALLMNLFASIADNFFSLLMPFSPQVIGHYYMFFLCMLIGGIMMLILAASGIRLILKNGDFGRCVMYAVMAAIIHIGMMYTSAPNQVMYMSSMLLGTIIPVVFILAAAVSKREESKKYQ